MTLPIIYFRMTKIWCLYSEKSRGTKIYCIINYNETRDSLVRYLNANFQRLTLRSTRGRLYLNNNREAWKGGKGTRKKEKGKRSVPSSVLFLTFAQRAFKTLANYESKFLSGLLVLALRYRSKRKNSVLRCCDRVDVLTITLSRRRSVDSKRY